jgi:uncharacterized protein YcnI
MKKSMLFSFILLLSLAFGGMASAHVTVQPKEVPANSFQVFTLRVPSEKEAATTQVKVEIPAGVEVSRFEPKPDWTYETEKNADGKITAVTWKTSGAGLGETEFGQFNFQGKVAADAKELVWKAHQTYSDGSVVDWTGAPDAEKEASVTKVAAAQGGGDGHGAPAGTADAHDGESNDNETMALAIAIAGFAIAVVSLILVLVRRGKRA